MPVISRFNYPAARGPATSDYADMVRPYDNRTNRGTSGWRPEVFPFTCKVKCLIGNSEMPPEPTSAPSAGAPRRAASDDLISVGVEWSSFRSRVEHETQKRGE